MANPLDLSRSELEALRELQAGVSSRGADDPIWDALEQFGLVEWREKAHARVLTPDGRAYLTG
jgi:ribosomal protein S19E (S16A)